MSDSDQPDLDLDLIAMVQRARMQHDAEAQPSQINAIYWVEAKRLGIGASPTSRAGYFSIQTTIHEVDSFWKRIKEATESGTLGYKSKVSTASRGGRLDAEDREIRIQTVDADDSADVERVRAALIALGVTNPLYKRGDTD